MRMKVYNNFGLEVVILKLKINFGFFFLYLMDFVFYLWLFEEEKYGKIGGVCIS